MLNFYTFKSKIVKTFLLVVAAIMTTICMSQINVPSTVQSSFAKFFPGISVKKWDKEEEKYEANFTKDGKSMSAVFNTNGILEETETVIAAAKLPAPVIPYVREHYKGFKIEEAVIILKSNGEVIYEAAIKGKDLVFDSKGNFLKEE